MTHRIERLLEQLKAKEYISKRDHYDNFALLDKSTASNQTINFKKVSKLERPVIFEGDRFGFYRSTDIYITGAGNLTLDFSRVISRGFDDIINEINDSIKAHADEPAKVEYGKLMLDCIDTLFEISDKYRDYAKEMGNQELFDALSHIPRKPARTFYEALVFLKLSIYAVRLEHTSHLTLGRFDQYMYPYYLVDKKNGISDAEIFELIEEFFISISFDNDIYPGMQQGDNGQSMVLGGFDRDGKYLFNEISRMCIEASLELNLIDPKINIRVGKNTPDEIYLLGTELTKKGLGFPQYCNDDVVIPGLIKLGYDQDDAYEYTVAACWEHIIPGKAADIPNISTMDFPKIVGDAIKENLLASDTFDELMTYVNKAIITECDRIITERWSFNEKPIVLGSVYLQGPTKELCDAYYGGVKYYNYGCHGAGISTATDALAATKKTVFDDKSITKDELIQALENNFEGFEWVRNLLLACPKMGNNDDYVDSIAESIMRTFGENMNGRDNGHGGIWRAGTGSAMNYIIRAKRCPATADGRRSGEPYASSFSPSIGVKTDGILSVIKSFTKFDMTNIINGGPLTLEIHDTVFRNDIGIEKTAALVKAFISLGGHQLQLNSINRERLLDAQAHPENHSDLIVRVWGWSGYFNELDLDYQNHIIKRTEYMT